MVTFKAQSTNSVFAFRFVAIGSFLPEASFWPSGIVVACVCVCVCVSVRLCVNHLLVRAITRDLFKLGSPNLDQRCKRPWLRSLFFFFFCISDSKFFFSLWRCALGLWNSPWFVSMLFRDCFTVSTAVHMGKAQPKWNGASNAVVLYGYAPVIRLKMAISGRHAHIHTGKTDISR